MSIRGIRVRELRVRETRISEIEWIRSRGMQWRE